MEQQKADLPKWFTPDFFVDIFEKKLNLSKDEFKVNIISVQPYGGAGENYTSNLYRAQIEARKNDDNSVIKKLSAFVKALITMVPELKQFSVFPNEEMAYKVTLPAVEAIWIKNANKSLKLGPECYKIYSEGIDDVIVLEDISVDDAYKVIDRFQGLDVAQSKMALDLLAKYHAGSATHLALNGMIDGIKIGFFQPEKKPIFELFIATAHKCYLKVVKNWSFGAKYAKKLENVSEQLIDFLESISKFNPDKLNVIAHGDMWINNILFAQNEGQSATDIRFIDFQHGYYGTPVLDLYNFLLTSVSLEFKVEKFDELVKYYYDSLVESLEALKYPKAIPTFDDFLKEMTDAKFMATQICATPLAIVLAQKNENASIPFLMQGSEAAEAYRQEVFNCPMYVAQLEKLLPFLDSKGMFDV